MKRCVLLLAALGLAACNGDVQPTESEIYPLLIEGDDGTHIAGTFSSETGQIRLVQPLLTRFTEVTPGLSGVALDLEESRFPLDLQTGIADVPFEIHVGDVFGIHLQAQDAQGTDFYPIYIGTTSDLESISEDEARTSFGDCTACAPGRSGKGCLIIN